jgi:predicted nucleic acid-binding protein
VILADTSGVFAALDRSQRSHEAARTVVETGEALILSPFVLAELDYLLSTRVSVSASVELLRDVEAGAYELAPFTQDDIGAARLVVERNGDLGIELADASIVVLADRYECNRVLTLDDRHFRALRTTAGAAFTLLPTDA